MVRTGVIRSRTRIQECSSSTFNLTSSLRGTYGSPSYTKFAQQSSQPRTSRFQMTALV